VPYTVVFLWISALQPVRIEHVSDFAAARGLSFKPLVEDTASAGSTAYDGALVDRLEGELEQARTALSALEEESAGERLARTEAELLAHPHLPQAGFLMAECLALRAQLARAHDEQLAEQLASSRAALEGPRAAAFGESGQRAAPAVSSQAVRVSGLSRIDQLEIDGQKVEDAGAVALAPGLHHVQVWRGGRPLFATFAQLHADQQELRLPLPPLQPCGADDLRSLRGAQLARDGVPPIPKDIACPSWALVRSEGTGIGVALCSQARCGAFVHWEKRPREPFNAVFVERSRLPPWATFAIVGAATAAAASLVLWQSGALERGNPNAGRFRYDGVNPQALSF
jgi:hypothetical protein